MASRANIPSLSDAIKKAELGSGAYGKVYDVDLTDGSTAALKRNLIDTTNEHTFMASIRELDILQAFSHHPLFVKIIKTIHGDAFEQRQNSPRKDESLRDDKIHFVLEKAHCTLYDLIYDEAPGVEIPFSYEFIKTAMMQMLVGLEYLHAKGYYHRDIKPANYLVFGSGSDPVVKLCDFGMSRPLTIDRVCTPRVVTSWYRPPEVLMALDSYDERVDVWSLGMVFLEMISREPFCKDLPDDDKELFQHILTLHPERPKKEELYKMFERPRVPDVFTLFGPDAIPEYTPKSWHELLQIDSKYVKEFGSAPGGGNVLQLIDLVSKMLKISPENRPTAKECLAHPFFKSVKNKIDLYRSIYPPVADPEPTIVVASQCIEREWFYKYMRNFFDAGVEKYAQFSVERMFLAIDIFDRALAAKMCTSKVPTGAVELDDRGVYMTRREVERYALSCLHIACKYYTTTTAVLGYANIASKVLVDGSELTLDPDSIKQAEHLEYSLITEVCQKKIYRPTLYDAATMLRKSLNSHEWFLVMWYHMREPVGTPVPLTRAFEHYLAEARKQLS